MNTRKGPRSLERERIIVAGVQSRRPMKAIAHDCDLTIAGLYSWINQRPALKLKLGNIRKKHRRHVPDDLRWQRAKNQVARLEKVLANHPPFVPRTLKAPSDPKFALQAIFSYLERTG